MYIPLFSSYVWIVDCVFAKLSVPRMTAQNAKPNDGSKEPYCQYVIMRSIQIIFESKTYHSLIYVALYHESNFVTSSIYSNIIWYELFVWSLRIQSFSHVDIRLRGHIFMILNQILQNHAITFLRLVYYRTVT